MVSTMHQSPNTERPDIERSDIERIVEEVIRRLRLVLMNQINPGGAAAETSTVVTPGTQQLTDHVITMDSLARVPASTRRLAVCRGAVVTPSVKDELRKRKIELSRVDATPATQSTALATQQNQKPQPTKQLLIANYQPPVSSRELIRALQAAGVGARQVAESMNPEALAATLANSVDCRHVALVMTGAPHVVTCAANRNNALRAAYVQTSHCVSAALQGLDANVVVADPTRWSTRDLVTAAQAAVSR